MKLNNGILFKVAISSRKSSGRQDSESLLYKVIDEHGNNTGAPGLASDSCEYDDMDESCDKLPLQPLETPK